MIKNKFCVQISKYKRKILILDIILPFFYLGLLFIFFCLTYLGIYQILKRVDYNKTLKSIQNEWKQNNLPKDLDILALGNSHINQIQTDIINQINPNVKIAKITLVSLRSSEYLSILPILKQLNITYKYLILDSYLFINTENRSSLLTSPPTLPFNFNHLRIRPLIINPKASIVNRKLPYSETHKKDKHSPKQYFEFFNPPNIKNRNIQNALKEIQVVLKLSKQYHFTPIFIHTPEPVMSTQQLKLNLALKTYFPNFIFINVYDIKYKNNLFWKKFNHKKFIMTIRHYGREMSEIYTPFLYQELKKAEVIN